MAAAITGTGAEQLGDGILRTSIADGPRVVTEALPSLRSATFGFWVGTGSRDEEPRLSGASHFLEHLLFKGTPTRSALEIAQAIESVGGDMNAFTTKEYTAFHVRVPDTCQELALDILSDVMWAPSFRSDEVESERKVILEEIKMNQDTPDDLVHEVFSAAAFPNHALGREVLGEIETITEMHRDDIAAFHRSHYRHGNVVVAAAGNVDHEMVTAGIEARMVDRTGQRPERVGEALPQRIALSVVHRDTEQAHIVLGMRALSRHDEDRYVLAVLNQAIGGGMSSRLFQEVREQRGLAYSVFSYSLAYGETGAWSIYTGTSPDQVDEVLKVIGDLIDRVVSENGISQAELVAAKGHLTGSLRIGLESSSSRMQRLGRYELTLGEIPSIDELVAEIEGVSAEDIARVVERVMAPGERTLAVVGPVDRDALASFAR